MRRFDCSFIFACPVQTSVGELDLDGYVGLRSNLFLNRSVVLAGCEHCPCDPCQFVGQGNDSHILMCSGLQLIYPGAYSVILAI